MSHSKETVGVFPCHRCSGAGRLPQHGTVLGGVCFKCAGSGRQKSAPKKSRAFSWNVYAEERASGARIQVFRVSGKTADEAIVKARRQLARGTGYLPDSVTVTRVRK